MLSALRRWGSTSLRSTVRPGLCPVAPAPLARAAAPVVAVPTAWPLGAVRWKQVKVQSFMAMAIQLGYSWIVRERKSWLHEFHRPGFTVVVMKFATHDHCITGNNPHDAHVLIRNSDMFLVWRVICFWSGGGRPSCGDKVRTDLASINININI